MPAKVAVAVRETVATLRAYEVARTRDLQARMAGKLVGRLVFLEQPCGEHALYVVAEVARTHVRLEWVGVFDCLKDDLVESQDGWVERSYVQNA